MVWGQLQKSVNIVPDDSQQAGIPWNGKDTSISQQLVWGEHAIRVLCRACLFEDMLARSSGTETLLAAEVQQLKAVW